MRSMAMALVVLIVVAGASLYMWWPSGGSGRHADLMIIEDGYELFQRPPTPTP